MSAPKHFLHLQEVARAELRRVLDDAAALKRDGHGPLLAGKTLAMIFDKPSTRTRVSFEVAMTQLGGHAVLIDAQNSQLGRGETIGDTARVLSRYCDVIMIRTGSDAVLAELAANASVPVINGLTDGGHPCQLMADVMTFEEHRGNIAGRAVAWVGDGNNMAISWTHAAVQFGFELRLACPRPLAVPGEVVEWARAQGASVLVTEDPHEAVAGADCVVADTWVSMGDEPGDRHNLLMPYQVNGALMARAGKDAIFMHCLPAHRGEEVTAEVMDGPQSVVWDEAENRLHAQKAILNWCLEAA